MESRRSASLLVHTCPRSCVSRCYYAAYARVTHELVASYGTMMPADREGPDHPGSDTFGNSGSGGIRRLASNVLTRLPPEDRQSLSELLRELYTLRLSADYRPSRQVDQAQARNATSMMTRVFSIV